MRRSTGRAQKADEGCGARLARKRPPRIVLVVSCTQRKRIAPPAELRLGSVGGVPGERSEEWRRRLQAVDERTHPIYDLYVGEHWRAVRDAYELALKFSSRTELWVISAGHGLIAS